MRLTEVLDALVPAMSDAAATLSTAARVEALVEEVDGTIRRLVPAIERLAAALDHPAVDEVPATLARIDRVVRPLAAVVGRATERMTRGAPDYDVRGHVCTRVAAQPLDSSSAKTIAAAVEEALP